MERKAQIGIGETIAVIIVFIMLVTVGMVIYVNYQTGNIKDQQQKATELQITQLLTTIQSLPEMQCSSQMCVQCGGSDLSYTYDLNKSIIAAKVIGADLPYYVTLLKSAKVELDVIDPRRTPDIPSSILVYNLSLPGQVNARAFQLPANVYDPATDMCYLGELNITVYTQ